MTTASRRRHVQDRWPRQRHHRTVPGRRGERPRDRYVVSTGPGHPPVEAGRTRRADGGGGAGGRCGVRPGEAVLDRAVGQRGGDRRLPRRTLDRRRHVDQGRRRGVDGHDVHRGWADQRHGRTGSGSPRSTRSGRVRGAPRSTASPRWKPAAPGGLRAVAASRRVTLTWNAPASNGAAITDYIIQRSTNGRPWATVGDGVSTARSYVVTGLTNGVSYRFRVAAKNAVGVGSWSLAVRATPGPADPRAHRDRMLESISGGLVATWARRSRKPIGRSPDVDRRCEAHGDLSVTTTTIVA